MKLTHKKAQTLITMFKPGQVISETGPLLTYRGDAGLDVGYPEGVVLPESPTDIMHLVRWAQQERMPITGRGSGTGYTGGAVASEGGLIVVFSRMANIHSVDQDSRQVTVQPGVINAQLSKHLEAMDLAYPPDPASHTVCTLGGNIAFNAGGPHCMKYGVTSNYVLGLEVVLSDGSLVQFGGAALDPPEYDFTSLLTGSEGTLGLITSATLALRRPHKAVKALSASYKSVREAGKAVTAIIRSGIIPATIELMDASMIKIVDEYLDTNLAPGAAALLILDVDGYPESVDQQLDEIEAILKTHDPIEVKIARTTEERELLWRGRRSAAAAMSRISPNEYHLDVSVPRSRLAEALTDISDICKEAGLRNGFLGHAGDGNIHPNLFCDFSIPGEFERAQQTARKILKLCTSMGGSIAAEHGVGIEKREHLLDMYQPGEIAAMLEVKEVFDPQGLFNPGKVFPDALPVSGGQAETSFDPQKETYAPGSANEASEALRALQDTKEPIYIRGGGSKWRDETPGGLLLTTERLHGIVELAQEDFYVRVRAGTTLDELQAELAEAGFWVPLASPWKETTIGGLVSARANAPLRTHYGGIGDLLMAVQVALPDGRQLRFGKALVKDVAGYAMKALFAGAFGTLGLVCEATLKVFPRTHMVSSLMAEVKDLTDGVKLGLTCLRSGRICAGLVLIPNAKGATHNHRYTLVYTSAGHPRDVFAEMRVVRQVITAAVSAPITESTSSATELWAQALEPAGIVVRAAVPASRLPQTLSNLESELTPGETVVDIANGQIYRLASKSAIDEIEALLGVLRREARVYAGHATLFSGPRAWLGKLNATRDERDAMVMMRKLKQRWDPGNILNRGEFVR